MEGRLVETSKTLSWLLRHGATDEQLPMDAAGWVDIQIVLDRLSLTRAQLDEVVATNTKRRLQVEGERIRCCQGHSTSLVTADALEASWREWRGEVAWHGTSRAALEAIVREGLTPQRRTHVHLIANPDSTVAKRAKVDLLLEVDAARMRTRGLRLFEAPNGVVLTREVPSDCLGEAVSVSKGGR